MSEKVAVKSSFFPLYERGTNPGLPAMKFFNKDIVSLCKRESE